MLVSREGWLGRCDWLHHPFVRAGSSLPTAVLVCVVVGGTLMGAPALAAGASKVEEQWVTHVSATSAMLEGKIDPGEAATTYRFEYATSEASLLAGEGELSPAPPASEGQAGAGSVGVVVEEHPQDLQTHTTYWYRVVATNIDGKTLGCEAVDTCESFTTWPSGGEFALPDGRKWELVSPPPGPSGTTAELTPSEPAGGVIQAAQGGGAITYLAIGSVEANPAGSANFSQILARRGIGGGWASQDIATPHEVATGIPFRSGQEYRFFSSDLSVGLVEPLGSGAGGLDPEGAVPLSPGASEKTVYVRANTPILPESPERGVFDEAVAEGGYRPLVTGCPLVGPCAPKVEEAEDVPPGTNVGGNISFRGATPDLSHVVLFSPVPLTATTPDEAPSTEGGLYEWVAGKPPGEQLQLVSILHDGKQESPGRTYFGERGGQNVRGAISSDGSRIVWSTNGQLFLRDVSSEQSVQLDAVQGGKGEGKSPAAQFQFASSDGSEVFFTDEEQLTSNSTAEPASPDLYECEMVEVQGELECHLSDLTPNPSGHADVQDVVLSGADDSSTLYLVANGVLTGAPNAQGKAAVPGHCGENVSPAGEMCNLYVLHYDGASWTTTFITSLSDEDRPDWGAPPVGSPGDLQSTTSRVSPDGEYLAFMSERPLTEYDNHDANTGEPDEEVYLYRAPSAGLPLGRLVCASCNPTGERPIGVLDPKTGGLLVDTTTIWNRVGEVGRWLAAIVPGWTAMEENVARYQPRYLSDEGRLFFNSSDALVPQAKSGSMDVYEYEPVGVGGEAGCTMSSVTFSDRSDGCVALISSGASGGESVFLDASESGDDVFFLSSAQLVPTDTGSGLALYDAHVCRTLAPCAAETASSPPCATEASCKESPTPQPTTFGPSGSATFSGAGNPPPAVVRSVVKSPKCKKAYVKKHNKCVRKKRAKAKKSAKANRRAK